jgi:hypothetical protein
MSNAIPIGAFGGLIVRSTNRVVEIADTAAGPWRVAPYLDAVSASESVLPSIQQAELSFDYGSILREDQLEFLRFSPSRGLGMFCRIQTQYGGGDWVVRWAGFIPRASFDVLGVSPARSGVQTFSALGIEYFLAREAVASAFWATADGPRESSARATFNEPGAGGRVIGNMSEAVYTAPNGLESRIFDASSSLPWTAAEILRYVLAWHASPECPPVELSGQVETLEVMAPTLALTGQSIIAIVSQLIDRRRGLNARILWGGDQNAIMRVATETAVPIILPGVSLPANESVLDLDLASGPLRQSASVTINREDSVSEVIVRGAPLLATFSINYHEGSLVAGWSAQAETDYFAAGDAVEGYSAATDETKKLVSDQIRQSDPLLADVFRLYTVPDDFPWEFEARTLLDPFTDLSTGTPAPATAEVEIPAFKVLPAFTPEGFLDRETLQAAPERIRRFSPITAILRGFDYSGEEPVYTGDADNREEPEPPAVYVLGVQDLTAGSVTTYYEFSTGGGNEGWAIGNVGVTADGLSIRLGVAPIPHSLGLNTFTGANPSTFPPVADWRDMIATVAVEGEPVEMRRSIPGNQGKRIVIDVPDAGLWWIAPGTVTAVDDQGKLVRVLQENGILTRDDRAWLESILVLALGWYGRQRASIQATAIGIGTVPAPQTMIRRVDAAIGTGIETNSLVTNRRLDFAQNKTSFSCDYAELDAVAMVQRSPFKSSALGGVGMASQSARADGRPQRFATSSRGSGSGGAPSGDPVPFVTAQVLANGG